MDTKNAVRELKETLFNVYTFDTIEELIRGHLRENDNNVLKLPSESFFQELDLKGECSGEDIAKKVHRGRYNPNLLHHAYDYNNNIVSYTTEEYVHALNSFLEDALEHMYNRVVSELYSNVEENRQNFINDNIAFLPCILLETKPIMLTYVGLEKLLYHVMFYSIGLKLNNLYIKAVISTIHEEYLDFQNMIDTLLESAMYDIGHDIENIQTLYEELMEAENYGEICSTARQIALAVERILNMRE